MARDAIRRMARAGVVALALVPVLVLTPVPALAASPYPTPGTAAQLACDLSPAANPGEYASWWAAVPGNSTYVDWFWNGIVPNGSSACTRDVAGTFWNQAVPANWDFVGDIGGWPWASGGYYTQTLWLRAIPGNWAVVADIGGWFAPSGGYYAQQFWLHAVPDNWVYVGDVGGWPWASGGYYTQWLWLHAAPDGWAPVANIGGWPSATGGYYTQWFWLHAVPDNWVPAPQRTLGHLPTLIAAPDFSQPGQGYYRYWMWEGAVPDNWAILDDIGGWPWGFGGYYTQWFWLHAAPDEWAVNPAMAIDGKAGAVGYYDYDFYAFATVRDFAWRAGFSLGGSSGAGYYDYWYHQYFGQNHPHYAGLISLAGGYLANAAPFRPVDTWLGPGTQAAVLFTFDTEGTEAETCALTSELNSQGVPATFYLVGWTAQALTPTWIGCLAGMDIEDHTVSHPGGWTLDPATFMSTLTDAAQQAEVKNDVTLVRAQIPDATMTSFRAPWTDGSKSFDGSVIRNLIASGMTSDRSIATIPDAARAAGVVPPLGLSLFSLSRFPSPFVAGTSAAGQLVEFPFSYPSDWTSAVINGLNPNSAPPSRDAAGYTAALWEREFDEIYSQHGVMVLAMHPWIQASGGAFPAAVHALITYMSSRPGVVFTTVATASSSARVAMGLAPR